MHNTRRSGDVRPLGGFGERVDDAGGDEPSPCLIELDVLHRYAATQLSALNKAVPSAVEALRLCPRKVVDAVFGVVVVERIPEGRVEDEQTVRQRHDEDSRHVVELAVGEDRAQSVDEAERSRVLHVERNGPRSQEALARGGRGS